MLLATGIVCVLTSGAAFCMTFIDESAAVSAFFGCGVLVGAAAIMWAL